MVNQAKIYIKDMPCFSNATERQLANKHMGENRYFNLEKLPTGGTTNRTKTIYFIQRK